MGVDGFRKDQTILCKADCCYHGPHKHVYRPEIGYFGPTGEVMAKKKTKLAAQFPVGAGNPCPFLRALVADGSLSDGVEPVTKVAGTIVEVAKRGEGAPELNPMPPQLVAMIAHGVSPLTVLHTKLHGVQLNALRNGPLDKRGAGSGFLDVNAQVNREELERLKQFASNKTSSTGATELGLSVDEITQFMDANLRRAKQWRLVDRFLMNGEWPVLLEVMGKDGPDGRYLSVDEVVELVAERRLPERMRRDLPGV
jgi:hypothetical protein